MSITNCTFNEPQQLTDRTSNEPQQTQTTGTAKIYTIVDIINKIAPHKNKHNSNFNQLLLSDRSTITPQDKLKNALLEKQQNLELIEQLASINENDISELQNILFNPNMILTESGRHFFIDKKSQFIILKLLDKGFISAEDCSALTTLHYLLRDAELSAVINGTLAEKNSIQLEAVKILTEIKSPNNLDANIQEPSMGQQSAFKQSFTIFHPLNNQPEDKQNSSIENFCLDESHPNPEHFREMVAGIDVKTSPKIIAELKKVKIDEINKIKDLCNQPELILTSKKFFLLKNKPLLFSYMLSLKIQFLEKSL